MNNIKLLLKSNVKEQIEKAKMKDKYKVLYDICFKRMQEEIQRAWIKNA